MRINPKHVILVAVSNYVSKVEMDQMKLEIGEAKRLTDDKFIRIIERHFDFKRLRDDPAVSEDIWLFNYLMYENHKKDNFSVIDTGEKISIKGKFQKKGLILKYYRQIVEPQLKALNEAELLISRLY
jgi:hypothetical protein